MWYVTTGPARDGGERLAGPVLAQDTAIEMRGPLEAERGAADLWVMEDSDQECPAA